MHSNELKNKAIDFLSGKYYSTKVKPCKFSPKEITDVIGGTHTLLGRVQEAIVAELNARGIRSEYEKVGNSRYFILRE